ncbi:MAG: LL-diaminopimelate aminotransferase [Armatimonadetes bacterium]|nr:LL-diaminopimelate aminotransferase [Armatimonadota bacterium]
MQRAKRLSLIPPYLFGEIARLKAQAIAEGRDLVDLGIGDPDQPTPEPIIEQLNHFAHNPSTHRYDESNAGVPEFLEDVATWFQDRFGVTLDPRTEILELIGSKEGLAHVVWAFLDPGDVALVPDPAYTVVKVNTLLAGGEPYELPLLAENGFLPDLTNIPGDIVKKAKLLYINYPNNPTGAVATREFFKQAVDFARETDTLIVHDCAYAEVGYDGYRAPSILEIDGAKDVAIETHSLSKTFNMTGWRIGFAVGNPDALKALNTLKGNVDSKQFAAIALTGGWALNHARNDASLELLKRRRDILVDGLNRLGWKLERPKASFYVWVPVPPGHTSATFAKELLEEASVLAIPGLGYGQHGDGYVRMSLTVSGDRNGERLEEAVRRIEQHIPLRW